MSKPPRYVGPAYCYSDRSPEARERIALLTDAAEAGFGNYHSAGVWLRRLEPSVGQGLRVIVEAASDIPEGLAEAQAELERIRPTVTPTPLPVSLAAAGRKRRRRR